MGTVPGGDRLSCLVSFSRRSPRAPRPEAPLHSERGEAIVQGALETTLTRTRFDRLVRSLEIRHQPHGGIHRPLRVVDCTGDEAVEKEIHESLTGRGKAREEEPHLAEDVGISGQATVRPATHRNDHRRGPVYCGRGCRYDQVFSGSDREDSHSPRRRPTGGSSRVTRPRRKVADRFRINPRQ